MEITSLKCNNCGANLEINPKIKFFTCTFCGSSLTIKKTGNVMFTEVLDEIKEDTEMLISHSELMLIEREIDRLDREWLIKREQYKVHNKQGSYFPGESKSEKDLAIGFAIAGVPIFIFIIYFGLMMGIEIVIVVIGFALVFIAQLLWSIDKESKYTAAKKKYEQQRTKLILKLNEKKQHIENENPE